MSSGTPIIYVVHACGTASDERGARRGFRAHNHHLDALTLKRVGIKVRTISLADLRRYALARSLFRPTALESAIAALGFVQADPIRAPARAQDLILRQRVLDYRAGDLDSRYAQLPIDEEYFVNYGFLPSDHLALFHPRPNLFKWNAAARRRAASILDFIRERGEVHPRTVAAAFMHGRVTNYWGGSSNATTHLLDRLHYLGHLRVARRDKGIRIYTFRPVAPGLQRDLSAVQQADALVALVVQLHAPLPGASLTQLVYHLKRAVPQLAAELERALGRAKAVLPHAVIGKISWYWPADEKPTAYDGADRDVRLLAPFDPVVWDRRRFELFWGWSYRFEAYTPEAKRRLGYYALPLLWGEEVLGWANVKAVAGAPLEAVVGYAAGKPPRGKAFAGGLAIELDRLESFLRSRGDAAVRAPSERA
jgi:uncharacterized protein YcaQ